MGHGLQRSPRFEEAEVAGASAAATGTEFMALFLRIVDETIYFTEEQYARLCCKRLRALLVGCYSEPKPTSAVPRPTL